MLRSFLRAKIHRCRVTSADLEYEGSIAVDAALLNAADIAAFEQVDVYNCTNGQRFTTYAIIGNEGEVSVKGAAARLVQPGDILIIACYGLLSGEGVDRVQPKVVQVDARNRVVM